MFTVEKIRRMQNRVEFVIGYRNLVNLIIVFFAATYLTLQWAYAEGFIVGVLLFVFGLKWFYDQVIKNIDDLECQDMIDKNETGD